MDVSCRVDKLHGATIVVSNWMLDECDAVSTWGDTNAADPTRRLVNDAANREFELVDTLDGANDRKAPVRRPVGRHDIALHRRRLAAVHADAGQLTAGNRRGAVEGHQCELAGS